MKQIQISDKYAIAKQQEFTDVLLQEHEPNNRWIRGASDDKPSLIRQIFPGKMSRLIREGKLKEAKTELDFANSKLKLQVQWKLNAIQEKYETWLRVIKVNYREQFYCFVTNKVKSLQDTIFDREAEFFDLMRKRYALIEKNKDLPSVVESYLSKIEREQEAYFAWLEFIMEDFQNIVKEKITDYERMSNS